MVNLDEPVTFTSPQRCTKYLADAVAEYLSNVNRVSLTFTIYRKSK